MLLEPKDENIDNPQLGFWESLSNAITSLPHILKETLDITSNYKKVDTIPVFIVTWKKGIGKTEKRERMSQITEWLNYKLDRTNVQVLEGK